jgi:hypothetical protein
MSIRRGQDVGPTRVRIVTIALVVVFGAAALDSIGQHLSSMHLPGQGSGRITDLANPTTSSDEAEQIIHGWRSWQEAAGAPELRNTSIATTARPGVVVAWWLAVDSFLFAPALALLLALLARRRRRMLERSWLAPVLSVAVAGALTYLLFDEIENALTAAAVYGTPSAWSLPAQLVSGAKWILLVLTALPVVLSYIPFVRRAGPVPVAPILRTVRLFRMPALAAGLAVVVLTQMPAGVRPQLEDTIRSWAANDRLAHGPLAMLGLLLFTAALLIWIVLIARRAADDAASHGRRSDPGSGPRWVAYGALGSALFAAGWLPVGGSAVLLRVVGVGLLVYACISFPIRLAEETPGRGAELNRNVARGIVAAPALALALCILRSVDLLGPSHWKLWGFGFFLVALLVAGAAWLVTGQERWLQRRMSPPVSGLAIGVLSLIAAGVAVLSAVDPTGSGWTLGPVALLLVFVIVVVGFLGGLEQAFWAPPRGAFRALGLTRAPITLLLVTTMVIVSYLDTATTFHAARVLERDGGAGPRDDVTTTAEDLLGQYQDRVAPGADARGPGVDTEVVFLIASSGGGARSAYWTLDVLNCLFAGTAPPVYQGNANDSPAQTEDAPESPEGTDVCEGRSDWSDVLAASGISGGSVGLAMFESHEDEVVADHRCADERLGTRPFPLEEAFDRGFLDPIVANMLFVDVPNAWARQGNISDRAEALELAFEEEVPALCAGFLETQTVPDGGGSGDPALRDFPVLMLNSAGATDGCRINVSPLDLAREARVGEAASVPAAEALAKADQSCRNLDPRDPGRETQLQGALSSTRDVADWVCEASSGADLRLSTAALLSARFPFVSPSGALEECHPAGDDPSEIFAVDGGYIESTAASPLVELLTTLTVGMQPDEPAPDGPPPSQPDVRTRCLQPVVLQLDNGYASDPKPLGGRPLELLAPLTGRSQASGARGDAARQALANLASHRCPLADAYGDLPTYLHIEPVAHPGIEAPLGWSLSAGARRDLDKQLLENASNRCAIQVAKAWLADDPPAAVPCEEDNIRVVYEAAAEAAEDDPLSGPSDGMLLLILAGAAAISMLLVSGLALRQVMREARQTHETPKAETTPTSSEADPPPGGSISR